MVYRIRLKIQIYIPQPIFTLHTKFHVLVKANRRIQRIFKKAPFSQIDPTCAKVANFSTLY